MIKGLFLALSMILYVSAINAMSEFDTLAQIIVSGFYSGNPVSSKFVADWAHSAPTRFAEQINEQYSVENEGEKDEVAEAMIELLGSKIQKKQDCIVFKRIINELSSEDKRLAVPYIFNYMAQEK